MVKISIFDTVVGDVVPLRIGDQVSILMFDFVLVGLVFCVFLNDITCLY